MTERTEQKWLEVASQLRQVNVREVEPSIDRLANAMWLLYELLEPPSVLKKRISRD